MGEKLRKGAPRKSIKYADLSQTILRERLNRFLKNIINPYGCQEYVFPSSVSVEAVPDTKATSVLT